MSNYHIVIFVEGETEEKFYTRLFKENKEFNNTIYKIFNVSGIGNFKKDALRKFKNLKNKKEKDGLDFKYIAILCYDSDVFERNRKPPIDFNNIERDFKREGVEYVLHFKAIKCIEDLFLKDTQNIFKFLKIKPCNVSGKNGVEKINKLYKKVNKAYIKGKTCDIVEHLDVKIVLSSLTKEIDKVKVILNSVKT